MSDLPTSGPVRLTTLGRVDLTGPPEIREHLLAQSKRLAVLIYLTLGRPRGFHRRDELVAVFWPELPEGAARNSLSQALHTLRQALGEAALITRGMQEVSVGPDAVDCDVLCFEKAMDSGHYEEAVELYQGPFLPAFHAAQASGFEEWLERERARLQQRYHEALELLARQAESAAEWPSAVRWRRALLDDDPLNCKHCASLVRALAGAGERAAGLRLADDFSRRFREEMGTDPDDQVKQAVREFQNQRPEPHPRSVPPVVPDVPPVDHKTLPAGGQQGWPKRAAVVGLVVLAVVAVLLWQKKGTSPIASAVTAEQVTFHGDVMAMSATKDGQWLGYITTNDSGYHLYVMDRASRSETRLHSLPTWLCCPSWSPDGTRLLVGAADPSHLLIFNRLGGPPDRIDAFFHSRWLHDSTLIVSWGTNWPGVAFRRTKAQGQAAYSIRLRDTLPWLTAFDQHPDGRTFLYAKASDEKLTRAYGLEVESLGVRTPASGVPRIDTSRTEWVLLEGTDLRTPIQLSPGGERLYFARQGNGLDLALWSVRLRAGLRPRGKPELAMPNLEIYTPSGTTTYAFKPVDRGRAYFIRGQRMSNIWTLESHRADAQRLTSGTALHSFPAVSPDGKRVAYVELKEGKTALWIAPFQGGPSNARPIDSLTGTPAWAPDGKRIAVVQHGGGIERIAVLRLDNPGLPVSVLDLGTIRSLRYLEWNPNGELLYGTLPPTGGNFYRVLADSSGVIPVLPPDSTRVGWLHDPRYSPDGRRLAFSWMRGDTRLSGLYILDVKSGRVSRRVNGDYNVLGWTSDAESIIAINQDTGHLSIIPLQSTAAIFESPVRLGSGFTTRGHTSQGRIAVHAESFIGDVWVLSGLPHR